VSEIFALIIGRVPKKKFVWPINNGGLVGKKLSTPCRAPS